MIDNLYKIVEQLDVRIFTLLSGKIIIGQVSAPHSYGIQLKCPLEINRSMTADGLLTERMTPCIAGNGLQPCIIYNHSIESECGASDDVRSRYVEALIYDRLQLLLHEENTADNDLSSPKFDPQDYNQSNEDIWDSFLERFYKSSEEN